MIAGGRRCGATSLFYWMASHPEVHFPGAADNSFFLDDQVQGLQWRDDQIQPGEWDRIRNPQDYFARFSECPDGRLGEKCSDLLFWNPGHARLKRYVPDIKLILTLRDPVGRAWSHYWSEVGKTRETLDFEEALAAEDARAARSPYGHYQLSYRARGQYDRVLSKLYEHFSVENVLVLILERSKADPVAAMRRVYEFIGVDPTKGLDNAGTVFNTGWTTVPRRWTRIPGMGLVDRAYQRFLWRNVGRVIKAPNDDYASNFDRRRRFSQKASWIFRRSAKTESMSEETRRRLREEYAPHVSALEEILGQPIPEWR